MELIELQKVLEKIGLEEKEAKVYLALLQENEATATKLSKATSLDRTLMYQITNKLINKGLASYVIKNNIRYFIASEPKSFLKQLDEKKELIQNALPSLISTQNKKKTETKVEIFQGRKGVSTVLRIMASKGLDYYFL